MQQKQERAVTDPRQTRSETAVEPGLFGFLADLLLDFLPLHAKRRIGEHVIEVFPSESVVGEGVSKNDIRDVLPLNQHIRLTDCVRLGIKFLPVHDEAGVGVHGSEMFVRHGKHSTGAGRRIIHRTDYAGFGERVAILDKEEVDHEPDDFARGEMFPGGFVGKFGELPDEFLEDRTHLRVGDDVGVEVDIGELFGDEIQEPGLGEPVDLRVEIKVLEDVAHCRRERLHVGAQVFSDIVLIPPELLQIEGRGVVEKLSRFPQEERLGIEPRRLTGRQFR